MIGSAGGERGCRRCDCINGQRRCCPANGQSPSHRGGEEGGNDGLWGGRGGGSEIHIIHHHHYTHTPTLPMISHPIRTPLHRRSCLCLSGCLSILSAILSGILSVILSTILSRKLSRKLSGTCLSFVCGRKVLPVRHVPLGSGVSGGATEDAILLEVVSNVCGENDDVGAIEGSVGGERVMNGLRVLLISLI